MITFIISLVISGLLVFWLFPRVVLIYALSRAITTMSKVNKNIDD